MTLENTEFASGEIARRLLGWSGAGNLTTADTANRTSMEIASHIANALVGPTKRGRNGDEGAGNDLGGEVKGFLAAVMQARDPQSNWQADRHRRVTQFAQYRHLAHVQRLVDQDPTGTLRDAIGSDYVISPDVVVWRGAQEPPVLHAIVACKWTIRSDRVQNIRHESVILSRHRKGKTPHIAVVTAEPLPSRLAAIARGTGEVDRTYHIALPWLIAALEDIRPRPRAGSDDQVAILHELLQHDRLADITELAGDLLL